MLETRRKQGLCAFRNDLAASKPLYSVQIPSETTTPDKDRSPRSDEDGHCDRGDACKSMNGKAETARVWKVGSAVTRRVDWVSTAAARYRQSWMACRI